MLIFFHSILGLIVLMDDLKHSSTGASQQVGVQNKLATIIGVRRITATARYERTDREASPQFRRLSGLIPSGRIIFWYHYRIRYRPLSEPTTESYATVGIFLQYSMALINQISY